MKKITRIMVPIDFSQPSLEALDLAADMAQANDAELFLLAVAESHAKPAGALFKDIERMEGSLKSLLEDRLDCRGESGAFSQEVKVMIHEGSAPEEIVKAVKKYDIGLIVMGTHGRQGIAHAVLGSVAEEVIRLAPCPVLTLKEGLYPGTAEKAASKSRLTEAELNWRKGE